MAGSMVYRLPVADVKAPHMVSFREAMSAAQEIKDNRGYNFIAGFHGAPGGFCWHHQYVRNVTVRATLFLPWHRAYLWWLEQALQDRLAGVALPWWDWTTSHGVPSSYRVKRIDGERNPLSGSRINVTNVEEPIRRMTRRDPESVDGLGLPTAPDIEAVLQFTDWPTFSDEAQNIHDGVHGWVGGDMGQVATAAYDPIFFAHHCMIDRLWYLWQVRHGSGGIPNELLNFELPPFGKRVRDVLDVQRLGYEYAASTTEIPLPGGGG